MKDGIEMRVKIGWCTLLLDSLFSMEKTPKAMEEFKDMGCAIHLHSKFVSLGQMSICALYRFNP